MTPRIEDIKNIIIRELFVQPKNIQKVEMGVMNYNYQFEIEDEDYIIRFYPDESTSYSRLEYDIISKLYLNGCKVPKPVKFLENKYLIYEMLPGEALSVREKEFSAFDYSFLAKQIVENIKCLSSTTLKTFGPLQDKSFKSWNLFLENTIREGYDSLMKNEYFNPKTVSLITEFLDAECRFVNCKISSLVWSDFSKDNIIIYNKELSGFVDFEGSMGGDPLLSLGYLFAVEGSSNFYNSVLYCYNQFFEVSERRIIFYAFIRLFRIAKHLNEPLPTGKKRSSPVDYFRGLAESLDTIKLLV